MTHDAFLKRHAKFFSQIDTLTDAENVVFGRTLVTDDNLAPVIFYLGIRSVQDFNAIVLLVANGHALPANALVRAMYERVVTAAYLRDNPDEVTAFINFDYVQRFKAAKAIKDTIGLKPDEEQGFEQLKKDYESVKADFMITDCKKSGTKILGPSWSKTHFVDMSCVELRLVAACMAWRERMIVNIGALVLPSFGVVLLVQPNSSVDGRNVGHLKAQHYYRAEGLRDIKKEFKAPPRHEATLTFEGLSRGTHQIRLEKLGYEPYIGHFTYSAGRLELFIPDEAAKPTGAQRPN